MLDLPKNNLHPTVARSSVAMALEDEYLEDLQVCTDASVDVKRGTATAAYTIHALTAEKEVLLDIETSFAKAEKVAIILTLKSLQEHAVDGKAVILTDSRGALNHIAYNENAPLIAQETAHLARELEDSGWRPVFQWVPSHSRIRGNK